MREGIVKRYSSKLFLDFALKKKVESAYKKIAKKVMIFGFASKLPIPSNTASFRIFKQAKKRGCLCPRLKNQ
jgi:hypothetical protein